MLLLDQIDGKVPRKLNTVRVLAPGSSNQHESLSGIETKCNPRHPRPKHGSNKHESLSGIETSNPLLFLPAKQVPINMNPYQGLKQVPLPEKPNFRPF